MKAVRQMPGDEEGLGERRGGDPSLKLETHRRRSGEVRDAPEHLPKTNKVNDRLRP